MEEPERNLYRKMHESIQRITRDMEGAFHFNTAIAQIMELMNALDGLSVTAESSENCRAVFRETVENILILISPFAPHIAEELWAELGHKNGILKAAWPAVNEEALARDEIDLVIQVNGKLRGKITIPADADSQTVEKAALESPAVVRWIEGKTVRKVIIVPGKLVNIAAS